MEGVYEGGESKEGVQEGVQCHDGERKDIIASRAGGRSIIRISRCAYAIVRTVLEDRTTAPTPPPRLSRKSNCVFALHAIIL